MRPPHVVCDCAKKQAGYQKNQRKNRQNQAYFRHVNVLRQQQKRNQKGKCTRDEVVQESYGVYSSQLSLPASCFLVSISFLKCDLLLKKFSTQAG